MSDDMQGMEQEFQVNQYLVLILFVFYIIFALDSRGRWFFASSSSAMSYLIDHNQYHSQYHPYSFDFYWNYLIYYGLAYFLTKYIFFNSRGNSKADKDPFTIKISTSNGVSHLQIGIFKFGKLAHHSIDHFEPLRLESDGSYSLSDSSKNMMHRLHACINSAMKLGNITISLIKLPSDNPIHHKFVMIAHANTSSYADFRGLSMLDISEPRFSRIKLQLDSDRDVRKTVFADRAGNLSFNVSMLSRVEYSQIELGIYEFDVLHQLIREYTNRKLDIPYLFGNHFAGYDLRKHPVFIDEPDNLLYIGSVDRLHQLLRLDFMNEVLLITDNQRLISQLFQDHPNHLINNTIHNIRINLIAYGIQNPQFLETLLNLWAKLLPDDSKVEYNSTLINSISQFVELKFLLDGKDAVSELLTRDLLVSKTYKEFNIDISVDVLTKFNGLFDLPLFNGFKQEVTVKGDEIHHLQDFLTMDPRHAHTENEDAEIRYRVLDISGLTERQKQALFILFCLMREHALIPSTWLTFSVNGSHKLNDNILKQLAYYQNFRKILLHVNEVGNDLSWIQHFNCKVHDKHLNHQRMRKYLEMEKNHDVDGLFLHQSFGRKTVLQTQKDTRT